VNSILDTAMQEFLQQAAVTLRGIWKFRWQGLIVAWIAAILGVAVVWRIPDRYEAAARVFVDTDSILKPLMSGLAVQPNLDQQISMLSRTLISRPNIEKLIRMADLDLKSQSKEEQEDLIEKLMKGIEIRSAPGVNLYSLAYRDKEPERAKRVLQSMVSIFIESGLGASRKDTDSAKTFLAEQIKSFEGKLEASETRLKEFRLRNLAMQGGDGKDSTQRLAEISQQLEAAKLQLKEAENARDAARTQLTSERVPATTASASPASQEAAFPVTTPELDGRIEVQKRSLDGLLQRYTDQHPDVVSTKRLLKELEDQKRREVVELRRAAMAAAAAAPTSAAPGPTASLAAQELGRSLAASEVQVASLKARVNEFSARYAAAREAMKTAPQIEAEAAQLNRDYAITKKNYDDLVARRQSAVMSGELDVASGMADFKLIDPPRVSPQPVSPNRIALYLLVLVSSLAMGVIFSLAASQLRPTFSDADELRMKTGLPLLGVVTMLTSDEDRRRQRLGLYRYFAASGGLIGLFVAGLIAMALTTKFGG
jgi:polysaccharide chain length determinant protein (PEP-CTERM system associated)